MAFRLVIAVWTTMLWLATATGLDPSGLFSNMNFASQSIDLLSALGLPAANWSGVTQIEGPQSLRPAYLLQGDKRNLKVSSQVFSQISEVLRTSPEFTISAHLRQESSNTGVILSISRDFIPYLEVESSGRKNELRLHYTSRTDSTVHVETFHVDVGQRRWRHVVVSVSGAQVEVVVDCVVLYKRLLAHGAPERNFSDSTQLWLGQRSGLYQFKGAMQDVRLVVGPNGYLSVCPKLESTCPTCSQFSSLQIAVQELTRHLQELSERLLAAEGRIERVEECDCRQSCDVNGTVYADGATWQNGCDLCSCSRGEIKCQPVECPKLSCKHPVNISGECCQRCLKHCLFYDVFYDHGELVDVKKCITCECQDGSMECSRIDPETECPKLNCPPEQQFNVSGSCCKYCPDIDECQQAGGLEGHHCNHNTKCVNTQGSYICECLPGYRRIDSYNCAELDECGTGEHNCDANADCVNTQGSYHCVCKNGYMGDGFSCEPVCEQQCLNGGKCTSPGVCACPNGYTSKSCERDLDECATNTHRCTEVSECVNMMGWYYCKCKKGYEGPHSDNNLGTLCQDINECERNLHTCDPSSKCVNLEGTFRCDCPKHNTSCTPSCMFGSREIRHGTTVTPYDQPCTKCSCNLGVLTCEKVQCDCSLKENALNPCCPQCDKRNGCYHQELLGVFLDHGEKWSYQCRACECQYGEVDCSDMLCPPLTCSKAVQSPNDCCPHCEDQCSTWNLTEGGQDCLFNGLILKSGSQTVDRRDNCTTCKCKDGALCCSYNYLCNGSSPMAIGYDGLVAYAADSKTEKPGEKLHLGEASSLLSANRTIVKKYGGEGESGEAEAKGTRPSGG